MTTSRKHFLPLTISPQIHEDQLIQSHTVLRSLADDAPTGESVADDHVLVVGGVGDAARKVAERFVAVQFIPLFYVQHDVLKGS